MATASIPNLQRRKNPDFVPAILLGGPAFLLLLVFLIGPFFAGVSYSFTNQRLISGNTPTLSGFAITPGCSGFRT